MEMSARRLIGLIVAERCSFSCGLSACNHAVRWRIDKPSNTPSRSPQCVVRIIRQVRGRIYLWGGQL
eukprot:scaffold115476_cov26-Prasinocladus_malaysianus.AAC.1